MYDDPVVPGGYDILGRQVPLLRIGDSLFSGDPTGECDTSLPLCMFMKSVANGTLINAR